jgi:hypothetical protein
MKRILITLGIIAAVLSSTFAQTPIEALRYSNLRPGGTARGLGVGGAMGAVGGDATAITINPAGIGVYRRSEAMVTLDLMHSGSSTTLNGNTNTDRKYNLNIGNIGVVFSKVFEDSQGNPTRGKWASVNFGLTYNRLANFHNKRFASTNGTANSILSDYRDELNNSGLTPDMIGPFNDVSFGASAAYNTYLLNPVGDSTSTQYSAITDGALVNQQIQVTTRGSIDELALTLGANYNNKFYLGGSLGLPFLSYTEEVIINETDANDNIAGFNKFKQENDLAATGVGVNVKLGMLFRPVTWWRIGAAFHTPNFYSISDNSSTYILSGFDTLQSYRSDNYTNEFTYNFNSPLKAIASTAFFIKQYGFISVDYEFADYGAARYGFPAGYGEEEHGLNNSVSTALNPTHTIRAGAEAAIKNWRLRGGYAYTTSPLEKSLVIGGGDYSSMSYSGGLGYRAKWIYVDFTYFRTAYNSAGQFASNVIATNQIKNDNYAVTVGFTF